MVAVVGVCLAIAVPVSVYLLDDVLGFGLILYSGENGTADPVVLTVFGITVAVGIAFAILMQVFRSEIERIVTRRLAKQNEKMKKLREESKRS